MTHETTNRDSDLRARMRSQSRSAGSYEAPRADYRFGVRRQVGQDVLTSKVTYDFPAQTVEVAEAKAKPANSVPIGRIPPQRNLGKPLPPLELTYVPKDISSRSMETNNQSLKPGLTFRLPAQSPPQIVKSAKRRLFSQTHVLVAMATVIFAAGLMAAYNGWLTNKHLEAQASHSSAVSEASGGDDSTNAPSTAKPSGSAVSSYAVAPNLPRYVAIDSLSVLARVMPMSVNAKNQLRAPSNVYDAGWYNASSQPGQPGAMLVDGHISSWQTHGVFYGINKLKSNDVIKITRGDGKVFSYAVRQVTEVSADKVDMSALLVSIDPAKPGLNLISCYGDVIPGTNEFDKRVVVQAVLQ